MFSAQPLVRRFKEARLDLALLDEPIARGRAAAGTRDIVQIDIEKARSLERFRIFPGASDNRVEVLGVDKSHQQLVLFVNEAARRFETRIALNAKPPSDAKVVGRDKFAQVIEQFTSPEKRHFLCGMDEQHLFIAQLPLWGSRRGILCCSCGGGSARFAVATEAAKGKAETRTQ